MNSLAATTIVLTDAGEALHYSEITRRILERDLWRTGGKTPAQTINSQLVMDIKNKGTASRFLHLGPGMFGLRTSNMPEPRDTNPPLPEMVSITKSGIVTQGVSGKATLSFADATEQVLVGHAANN